MRRFNIRGQYDLFGNRPEVKRRPCEYSFTRYIGQKVRDRHGKHTIAEIEPYYTIYNDGTIGTPHDMEPVDKGERLDSLKTELEYQKYLQKRERDSISQSNIIILEKLIQKAVSE